MWALWLLHGLLHMPPPSFRFRRGVRQVVTGRAGVVRRRRPLPLAAAVAVTVVVGCS